jgi:hypothetical protein
VRRGERGVGVRGEGEREEWRGCGRGVGER